MLTLTDENNVVLLKLEDVAKKLKISRSKAYMLAQSGQLPTVRFDRTVRVRLQDLEEFIARKWTGWKG